MPNLFLAAFLQRCPACGKGKLYSGLLAVRAECAHCRLPLKNYEKGDGPAFFAITAVGAIVTLLAGWVEFAYEPPFWLHAALWGPMIVVLSLYFLRFFKALLIAAQYKHVGLG